MTTPGASPPPRRLVVDGATRATAVLRGVLGVVLLVLSGVVLGVAGWSDGRLLLCAGVGFAFSLGWLAMGVRRPSPDEWYVDLGPDALTVRLGGAPTTVPWHEVGEIKVDEERLVVVVTRRPPQKPGTAPGPVRVPPAFAGLGVYALADLLSEARAGAPAHPANSD